MAEKEKQTTTAEAVQNNNVSGAANNIASALKQQSGTVKPATPSNALRTDMSTPTASTLPGNAQSAQATQLAQQTTQQPAQQPAQEPVAGPRVENPSDPYKAVYTDANGQKQNGYIINGTTYTDEAGTNPVGVGSVVTDQSGRQWIKTDSGSMLYSDYLAQQKQQNTQPGVQVPTVPASTFENNTADILSRMQSLLSEWKTAAGEGAELKIDYATQQAITELERALADAQPQFKTQQDQIAADEMAAKDNAALYAEMRGDKGGIGQAQYNAIANTAAINRQTVASEQTKLSTDTARQIADLRAQGEFEKADKLLEITQTYLSQLITLEQWAAEYNLSAEQFQEAIRQWEAEYELAVQEYKTSVSQWQSQFEEQLKQQEIQNAFNEAGLTGIYNGQLTLDGKNQISDIAAALLDAGMDLTDEQLASLGMTREQANAYILAQQVAAQGGGGGGGGKTAADAELIYNQLLAQGVTSAGDAYAALLAAGYTSTEAENLAGYYLSDYVYTKPEQLGTDARNIYNALTSGTMNQDNFDDYKNYLELYYNAGRIDNKETAYLLGLLGQ